jgi:hypothetical protein
VREMMAKIKEECFIAITKKQSIKNKDKVDWIERNI